MESIKIHFKHSLNTPFYAELKKRIEDYFRTQPNRHKANVQYYIKLILVIAIFLGSYTLILLNPFNHTFLLIMAIIFGLSSALVAFNIGHDASHHAIFNKSKWNDFFAYCFNLIGTNKYIWDIKHNKSHHALTNIPEYDADIEQTGLARIIPGKPLKWYHKYQHIYLPLLYPFFGFFLVFVKDFKMFLSPKMGNFVIKHHPIKEWLVLLSFKMIYVAYTIVIPFIVLDVTPLEFLTGYLIMHMCAGLTLALVLFPVHVQSEVEFPVPDQDGYLDNNWINHEIEVSSNYGADSPLITWIAGGLNLHIIHHIYPHVCHIHYPSMNKILRQVAREHSVQMKEYSLLKCFRLHLRYLKTMGNP